RNSHGRRSVALRFGIGGGAAPGRESDRGISCRNKTARRIFAVKFMNTVTSLRIVKGSTESKVETELSRTGGLLRLAPNWVPRSFLQPGKRLKLHPDDLYATARNGAAVMNARLLRTRPPPTNAAPRTKALATS